MKAPDPLAHKRKHLAKLLLDLSAARRQAIQDNWMIDVNPAQFERMTNRAEAERMVASMDEGTLDQLIAYHDPRANGQARYVW